MNGFERYQHQIELLEIAIDNQCAKEYMMEIDQCAIIMLCLYYKGIYSNVHMIDNKVPSTVDAILMLNNLAFDNLRDIPWEDITDGFDTYLTRVFVSLIERKDLKLAVLRCLLDEWHHLSKEDKESFDKGQEFEEYCQKEIEYISSTPKYDVSNFSKEEAIADLETAICDSSNVVSDNQGKSSKPKGRPPRQFEEYVQDSLNKDQVIEAIRICLTGKSDKSAALVVFAAIDMRLIRRPSYPSFVRQFPDVEIGQTVYNDGIRKNNKYKYTIDEIEGIKALLRKYMA